MIQRSCRAENHSDSLNHRLLIETEGVLIISNYLGIAKLCLVEVKRNTKKSGSKTKIIAAVISL